MTITKIKFCSGEKTPLLFFKKLLTYFTFADIINESLARVAESADAHV